MFTKFRKLFGAAAILLMAALPARAEIVENYFYDFTKPIDTSDPAFAVASGWGHVVDSYVYSGTTYYQSYSLNAYSGKTKGALNIGNEEVGGTWSKKKVNDIIVSPKVSGAVSLWLKSSAYSGGGSARFYAMKKLADGSYEQGAEYTNQAVYRLSSGWEEVVFDAIAEDAEYPYIGIHASTAYLSDFSAEKADIEKVHKLSITSISTNAMASGLICDENNMANVKLTVYLANVGDYSYGDDTENLTLSVFLAGKEEPLKTFSIGAIAEGASKNIECQLDPIPFSEIGATALFSVKENISGTTKEASQMTIREYKPIVTFRESSYSDVAADYVLNFGKINAAVSKDMYLSAQKGTAPATITAIECPAGYSVSVEAPLTLATTGRTDITVAFNPEGLEAGTYSGEIVLTVENGDPAKLPVSAELIDPSLIYIPFADNNVIPEELINANSSNLWKLDYSGYGSSRNNYIKPTSSYSEAVLVLPKLTFSADKKLTLDVRKGSSSVGMGLNFAYSADRTNWVELPDMTLNDRNDVPLTLDFQTYEVKGVPEGDYYLRLTGRDVYIDNIYGLPYATVAHDLELTDVVMPAAGMVNNRYNASLTIKNYNRKAEEADSYSVVLVVGDKEYVAEAAPEVPASQGTATISASFTPHAVGEFVSHMEVRFNDETTYTSAKQTINVAEERVDAMRVIVPGDPAGTPGNGYVLPVSSNGRVFSEQIYPADYINLPQGTIVNGISFLGKNTGEEYTTHLEAWVALSNITLQNTDKTPVMSTDGMTKVFDGDYTFPVTGAEPEWYFNIPFSENLVYDGESSLIIYLRAIHPDGAAAKVVQFSSYVNTADTNKWMRYRRWYINEDGSLGNTDNWNIGYAALNLVVETGVVSGKVMEGELPVEGAAVTLRSDNIEYYGTADAEGSYTIDVLQTGREYTATAAAEAFVGGETAVSFAEGMERTLDIAMLPATTNLYQGVYEAIVLPEVANAPEGTYYRFDAIEGNTLVFRQVTSNAELQANVPYIVAPDADCVVDLSALTFEHVAQAVTVAGTSFQGVYASRILRDGELLPTDLITIEGAAPATQADAARKVARATGAYITSDVLNPTIVLRSSASGIENVDAEAAAKTGAVYTIDGRLVNTNGSVEGLPAGIYIVNGTKVAVK